MKIRNTFGKKIFDVLYNKFPKQLKEPFNKFLLTFIIWIFKILYILGYVLIRNP